MKFFPKPNNENTKKREIQFMHNVFTALKPISFNEQNEQLKQEILLGALIATNLSATEILEEITDKYRP